MTDTRALSPRVPDLAGAWSEGVWARYGRDAALNLFRRSGFDGIDYNDGPDVERRVYEAVRAARDRGTYSQEFARAITDWPSEYHLSRERHCVVRPLGIGRGDRVLELGCGCGAITRYLGETGAQVTAVEGARLRAQTAAERCRDLPNVTVVIDDVLSFVTEQRFDWVLLVGVLEYAPVYSDAPDAVAALLRAAAALLAPNGRLVIATENKLGLKYFNGCGEDHVGVPFYGVQGLYGERTPRTFGRSELAALVRAAGLPHIAFRYPFPDYKLPRIVLTEAALADPGFDAAGTLTNVQARDYGGRPYRLFDEALVARELHHNGLLADFSNSFLLIAATQAMAPDATIATAFSAQRRAEFAIETRFTREGDAIRVRKTRLHPERAGYCRLPAGGTLEHVAGETAYVPGPLALAALNAARSRHADLAAIVATLTPWFAFLLARARPALGRRLADFALPGDHVDFTPFNLVETAQGLEPIDMEWRVDRDVPLGWVVVRGVVHSLVGVAGFEAAPVLVAEVVETLAARHGLAVSADEIKAWLDREDAFQQLTAGVRLPDYSGGLASRRLEPPPGRKAEYEARIGELTQTVARLKAQIADIHRSRSWRYSYPLRLAGQMLRGRLPAALARPLGPARGVRADRLASALPAGVMPPSRLAERAPWFASDMGRYGWAVLVVLACFALTSLLTSADVKTPRMLLYIAAVAIAARGGGFGPGVLALAASLLAIVLTVPSLYLLAGGVASVERLSIFLICAAIGILVSIPREIEHDARAP